MSLAEVPAGAAADAQSGAMTEADNDAESGAAPQPQSEPPAVWNHRRTGPTGVDGLLRRLAADLKLDAGQQAKIRPILVAQREQMQRLHLESQLAPAERQQRILALGDRSADQIRAQLNDVQRAQYIKPRAAPAPARTNSSGGRIPAAGSVPGAGKEAKP